MGNRQRLVAEVELGAKEMFEYQQTGIPGPLQTPEFTWALIDLAKHDGPLNFDPETNVKARAKRAENVFRKGGPAYEVVLDEVAVRRLTVPPEIEARQLDHLIEAISGDGQVTILVLPVDARITDSLPPRSTFTHYTFHDPRDPRIVLVDTVTEDLVVTESSEVSRYIRRYERLRDAALSPEESMEFLARAAEQIKTGS